MTYQSQSTSHLYSYLNLDLNRFNKIVIPADRLKLQDLGSLNDWSAKNQLAFNELKHVSMTFSSSSSNSPVQLNYKFII